MLQQVFLTQIFHRHLFTHISSGLVFLVCVMGKTIPKAKTHLIYLQVVGGGAVESCLQQAHAMNQKSL